MEDDASAASADVEGPAVIEIATDGLGPEALDSANGLLGPGERQNAVTSSPQCGDEAPA
jgi:hypothetical protein